MESHEITESPTHQVTKSPSHQLTKSPVRILLVRLREIGDVVFTTPALAALRHHFPHARVSYLVEPLAAPVVSSNPHIDEVIVAPRTHLLPDLALGLRLRAARYDLAIDFHGGPRASLLTWLSGAPVRVGYAVPGRAWMYTRRVDRPRAMRPRHAVRNQWDLLEAVGIAPADADTFAVEMPVDAAAATAVADRLTTAGLASTDRIIVIHVSAGNPFRRWPQRSFAEVVAALVSRHADATVIVMSGPSERDAARRVIDEARAQLPPESRRRVPSIADWSLSELRALLERAALFIGGDSGPLHIAATSAVPIVAVYGPTLPVRSAPWRDVRLVTESVEGGDLECRPCDQRACVPGDFRCLTRISSEAVIAAAERALTTTKFKLAT
jgi:lipopolysaccharide heptosyltransferase II